MRNLQSWQGGPADIKLGAGYSQQSPGAQVKLKTIPGGIEPQAVLGEEDDVSQVEIFLILS